VQVIKPAERLFTALAEENSPYFSTWPNDTGITDVLHPQKLKEELQKLLDFAVALRGELECQLAEPAPQTFELKADIVGNLLSIAKKNFPEMRFSRGQYNRKERKMMGSIPEFVRRAFFEITELHDELAEDIKDTLADAWEFGPKSD